MAVKKNNPRKDKFLNSLPNDMHISNIADVKGKISFSFKYFDSSQKAGQDFKDWTDEQKNQLLNKLRDYSREDKKYWLNQRVGGGGLKILQVYGAFPRNSDFAYPSHVPENVKWARFRMEGAVRLVGFFVDENAAAKFCLSTDIFYIVFLDKNHRFYKMEDK